MAYKSQLKPIFVMKAGSYSEDFLKQMKLT